MPSPYILTLDKLILEDNPIFDGQEYEALKLHREYNSGDRTKRLYFRLKL